MRISSMLGSRLGTIILENNPNCNLSINSITVSLFCSFDFLRFGYCQSCP